VSSQGHSAKAFKKNIESLPSAVSGALGKDFFFQQALGKEGRGRTPLRGAAYAESLALGK